MGSDTKAEEMILKTVRKVLREYSERSDAVANCLGGASCVFWPACSIVLFATERVLSTMKGLNSGAKVHSSVTDI